MCTIKFVPDTSEHLATSESFNGLARKSGIMNYQTYNQIIRKFVPYKKNIQFVTLHGCGEPLLDKTISNKIKITKTLGFDGVGLSTNCSPLTPKNSEQLLSSGLDTLIASIDGFTTETQEAIRPGTDRDRVYANLLEYINIRDRSNFSGRVLIRFIEQKLNISEWHDYHQYWSKYIDRDKGDDIIRFPIHNCGGKVVDFDNMALDDFDRKQELFDGDEFSVCPDLFERFIIFSSGEIGLCSADQEQYFDLGNIIDGDPIDLFNSEIFHAYRKKWIERKVDELKYCKDCTIAISRQFKSTPSIR
jgi:hypothetical protein